MAKGRKSLGGLYDNLQISGAEATSRIIKNMNANRDRAAVSTVGGREYKGRVKVGKALGDLKPGDRVVGGLYGGDRRGNSMGTVSRVQPARAKGYKVVDFTKGTRTSGPVDQTANVLVRPGTQAQRAAKAQTLRDDRTRAQIRKKLGYSTGKVSGPPSKATLENIGKGGIKGYGSMTPQQKDATIDKEIKSEGNKVNRQLQKLRNAKPSGGGGIDSTVRAKVDGLRKSEVNSLARMERIYHGTNEQRGVSEGGQYSGSLKVTGTKGQRSMLSPEGRASRINMIRKAQGRGPAQSGTFGAKGQKRVPAGDPKGGQWTK